MQGYTNILLASKKYRIQRDYWVNTLIDLKTDKIIQPSHGARMSKYYEDIHRERIEYNLQENISHKVIKLGKNSDISIYVVLLAAFNAFLYRYTGKEDLCVSSPLYKGNQAFNSIVLIRNKIDTQMTFKDVLIGTKESVINACNNQDYPFDKIIEELNLEDKESIENLFDLLFLSKNIHHKNEDDSKNGGIVISFIKTDNKIKFTFDYDNSQYDKDEIGNIVKYYFRTLEIMMENLSLNVTNFELLSSSEKEYLLKEFNDTCFDYLEFKTIDKLFEEQVSLCPHAIAIKFDNQEITYEELNERANILAKTIRNNGIKSGDIVGIIINRCPELIIGILAIIKAGGAYLPIDPEYPIDRINYMVKNSNTNLLLSKREVIDKIGFCGEFIDIEEVNKIQSNRENLGEINKINDLVYIIYTSGSTGKPKGVMIEHRGLVNYILWAKKVYLCNEKLDFPLYSSVSFDLTVTSIFTPLLSGNSIVIYKEDDDDFVIKKIIEENKVGILKATPTHLNLIKNMDFNNSALKKIIVGGEELKSELVMEILKKFDRNIEIYNEYGPTEATIGCMIYKFDSEKKYTLSVPIGVPSDNVQIYILDKHMKPVPKLTIGEIYIGGNGVARGYLNKKELTSEKFTQNIFTNKGKLYKTGDLARHLLDGNIEFVGRTDCQVKIRGFRIELGEIERVILRFPNIKEVVVVDREDNKQNKYLCAYFTTSENVVISDIKEFISKILPNYMIPTYFVEVDKIPINFNGKVDKHALIDPRKLVVSEAEYVEPTNEIERILVDIWKNVLEVDSVGINDDFFQIGGHSLKVTLLMVEILKAFDKQIPLKAIINNTTVKKLAEYIADYKTNVNSIKVDNVILLKEGHDKTKNLFFIHAGSGQIENYIELCNSVDIDYSCWGVKADKLEDYAPRNISIEEIAEKYINRIKKIQPSGPYYISGWCVGGTIAFEIVKQLEQLNEVIGYFAMIKSMAPESNKEFWGNVDEFSCKKENDIVNKLLESDIFKCNVNITKGTDNIWRDVINYIEKNDSNNEIVDITRKRIPPSVAYLMPNLEKASIGEIIHCLNMSRTLYNARAFYNPKGKITSQIHFFESDSDEVLNKERWNLFCDKQIKIYNIYGNHFSIFEKSNIEKFSAELKKSLIKVD